MGLRSVVDHRTDIDSLGVMLYEILTLRPAYPGRDRQEVLRQIGFDEPTPHSRLNSSIPRELETIVLKAMAKEPAGRYAMAQELSDDLRRFLEHRPIRARRPGPWGRFAKWSRRHRPLVATAGLMLVMATIGLAAALVVIARERDEASEQRRMAVMSAREALDIRRREEALAREARRAVDAMYTRFAERRPTDRPHLEPVRREFLEAPPLHGGRGGRSSIPAAPRCPHQGPTIGRGVPVSLGRPPRPGRSHPEIRREAGDGRAGFRRGEGARRVPGGGCHLE